MKIMVCKVYLYGRSIGAYADPRRRNSGNLTVGEMAGFVNRVHDFFVGLFGERVIVQLHEENEM